MSRISVIGAGHVGLVTAAGLAELGHSVTCVEADDIRLAAIARDALPIYEPGLAALVSRHRSSGRLRLTNRYDAAIADSEVVFVSVHTPAGPNGNPDTRFVFAAVRSIVAHASLGQVIVVKSTVPVGTCDEIAALVERLSPRHVEVVSNPEFLREGSAVDDFLAPDRIVIGAVSAPAAQRVIQLYERIRAPVVVCSRRSAELAKYAANAYLATRISFINEISTLCDLESADIADVARIMGLDRRIGAGYLNAGLGWGGSCFPKDVRALAALSRRWGCASGIFCAAVDINERQRQRVVRHLRDAVRGTEQPVVGVLGLAFKPETDDVRDSPALDIIGRLLDVGVRVRAHDPVAMSTAHQVLPEIYCASSAFDAARGSDAVLLATEWSEYLSLDWHQMRALMRGSTVVDGRNALDGKQLSSLSLRYVSMGRYLDVADYTSACAVASESAAGGA